MGSYGWIKDRHDPRDIPFAIGAPTAVPSAVDLRPHCPPVYDQGQLGSCTANAIGAAVEYDLKKQPLADFTPSRLFIYYNERALEGTVSEDSGAQIRDGIKTVAKQGVCPETEWPYNVAKFASKPSPKCYRDAVKNEALLYRRVPETVVAAKQVLAQGYPVVFGFTVYESFESEVVARTGVMPLPQPSEQVLGGHAVVWVGYDDATQRFITRNSWGPSWGQAGYFTMPYDYAQSGQCSDWWTITTVK